MVEAAKLRQKTWLSWLDRQSNLMLHLSDYLIFIIILDEGKRWTDSALLAIPWTGTAHGKKTKNHQVVWVQLYQERAYNSGYAFLVRAY
jgi:hypothetical protein